jgi:hypothetical protein
MLYHFIEFLVIIISCDKVCTNHNVSLQKMTTLSQYLKLLMIPTTEVINMKVCQLINIFDFY